MALNKDQLDKLAEVLAEKLVEKAAESPADFVDEDGFVKASAESAVESMLEDLTDRLFQHPKIREALVVMGSVAEEAARDRVEYQRAMTGSVYQQLRYVGMSVHDFI